MVRTLAILVFVAVIFSCGKEKNVTKEFNDDGTLKKKTVFTSPDNSDYREYLYYGDESPQEMQEYKGGLRHGRNFAYYPNGTIKSVYYYTNGKLTSIGRYYNEKGQVSDKGLFINDSLVAKEEFFYDGNSTRMNAFSKISGDFEEAGNLFFKIWGNADMYNQESSYFYIVHSMDSVALGDSLRVDIRFIGGGKDDGLSLTLGSLDENLQFTQMYVVESDSLAIQFYVSPRQKGYNLLTGILSLVSKKPRRPYTDFLFYHDFLTY